VGVADQAGKLPSALSSGQQQRVAIARALANDPAVVLADEPTGNLDSVTARAVLDLFREMASTGTTVVIATHERDISRVIDRTVELEDGALVPTTAVSGPGGREQRTRTALVVLAIALGISGFSTVLSTYAILTRELDRGYLATNPASATLRTDAIDDALVAAVLSGHGVSDAEPRRTVNGRIKTGPMEWRNLILFVVKDYGNIRVSTLVPEKGAWPPAAGEILIERDAFQVARVKIGDTVTVKTARGQEQKLHVAGSVHDVGQAQARMENAVYGYITLATLTQLGEEPVLNQLKILVARHRLDEKHIRQVAANVQKVMEDRGHAVSVDVPKPGKHPHAEITGLLLLAMSSFGVFVLILSGILVVNLLTALMASQIRQIGMMKAVGATSGQIGRIYFGQALLLGVAAIAVAVPAARVGSRVFCRYMAGFLNFDIASVAVPLWVDLLAAAIGLVVPLLASAFPVWKGSGIPVAEALSDFGVSRNAFGTTWLDRLLVGMGGVARPILLAIRNSLRRRARLVLTVVTLAAGGLFFMVALNVRASLIETLDSLFRQKKFDLAVSFGSMVPSEKIERAVRRTPGILQWEGWIASEGAFATEAGPGAGENGSGGGPHAAGGVGGLHGGAAAGADRFPVIALPAPSRVLKLSIIEGRDLQAQDTDAIVVNNALAAKAPQMRVGRSVTFQMGPAQTTWRVVGLAREPFSPALAYVPLRFFEERGHSGVVSSVRLALEQRDPTSINRLKAALEGNLDQEGVRALNTTSQAEGRFAFDQHMVMIYLFLIVMSCILAGVGGLGLMTTMSLNVLERRREMGVLRAIGATPAAVGLIVVAEGGLIAVLGWAIAGLAAWPVSKAVGSLLTRLMFESGLDFSFDVRGLLIWLAVSAVLAAIASLVPAWHASRRPVREAVGYE
jgi:putative ABC transport system permease protein